MHKYQNKYRIPSARLPAYDYGSRGAYFITICTKDKQHYFGEIVNSAMQLNAIGLLAQQYWLEIPAHFPFVQLGNFVAMPNHIHGILIIDKTGDVDASGYNGLAGNADVDDSLGVGDHTGVETLQCNVSTEETMRRISPKAGSISTIIRSYKSTVSKYARHIHSEFAWQPRFYDHIIRNDESFENIQHYIRTNPENWEQDKLFGGGV
jgi:REP element-mobilizing transposase RayT